MPQVVVVEVVESLQARLIHLFWEGNTCASVLHLPEEEVERGQHAETVENQEDHCRHCQPLLLRLGLHPEIEGEVHPEVAEKDEEEHRWELCLEEEVEKQAEGSVDDCDQDQKPEIAIAGLHVFKV